MSYNKAIFTKGTKQYKDIDFSFKANPTTGDLRTVSDDVAIKQSIKNIVLTMAGERPFDNQFGAGVYHMLFESMDSITKQELRARLVYPLTYYEPRATILDIIIDEQVDNNAVAITIKYKINNQSTPQVVSVTLDRIR